MKQRYTTTDLANLQKAKALYRKTGGLASQRPYEVQIFRIFLRRIKENEGVYVLNCQNDNATILSRNDDGSVMKFEFTGLLTNNPKRVCTKA